MSAPTTPLPILEEILPHHHRAVSSDRKQGPQGGDDIREGLTRVETRALNQEAAEGLVSLIDPDGGSRIFHALLAEKSTGRAAVKMPDWLVQEGDTTSTTTDCMKPSSSS